ILSCTGWRWRSWRDTPSYLTDFGRPRTLPAGILAAGGPFPTALLRLAVFALFVVGQARVAVGVFAGRRSGGVVAVVFFFAAGLVRFLASRFLRPDVVAVLSHDRCLLDGARRAPV